ncbi:MAG: AbrB/MazE/SpoVT family DNA-binding domain-containing protein [Planctomycetes bacterium]|nr:AbrB/MazE/SpoVT family DNA-binding domain-containing protein [Planctomycetota bacterium]
MPRSKRKYNAADGQQTTPAPAEASSVYERGQTVIPKAIREALSIEYGTRLRWEVREGAIHVLPIPHQPVRALRGALKGTGLTFQTFMQERQQERRREREREEHSAEEMPTWDTSSTPQP